MNLNYLQLYRRYLLITLFALVSFQLFASGSGPTTVTVGQTVTYSWNDGFIVKMPSWSAGSKGTVQSTSVNGVTYSCTVYWHTTGTGSVTLTRIGGNTEWTTNVTINSANPPAPDPFTVSTNACGKKTLTRGTPPSGTTWYWQGTNSSGTSTSDSASTYLTGWTSGYYYLRAYKSGYWSTSSTGVNVTVVQIPLPPTTPTISSNTCGDKTLTRVNPPSGITWYWQGTNSDGYSTSNSGSTYNVSSTGSYYIRGKNNTVNCWGLSSLISVTVNQVPNQPLTPGITNNCGSTLLTPGSPPLGQTYYWQTTSSGTATIDSGPVLMASGTVTYLRAQNDASLCWGDALTVNYTINLVPSMPPQIATPVENCGNTTLSIASPPGGITYYWQSSNMGTSTGESGTTIALTDTTIQEYSSRARDNTSGCWGVATTSTTFTVNPQIGATISPSPVDVTGDASGTVSLGSLVGTVDHWEKKLGSEAWETISDTGSSMTYEDITDTLQIRALLQGAACSDTYSGTATITPAVSIFLDGLQSITYGGSSQVSTNQFVAYQWVKDGSDVASATYQTFKPNIPGDYQVKTKVHADSSFVLSDKITIGNSLYPDVVKSPQLSANFYATTRILTEGVNESTEFFTLKPEEISLNIRYMDGLGRISQQIGVGSSPDQKDIIAPVSYDTLGRMNKQYMPYVSTDRSGQIRKNALGGTTYSSSEQYLFYQNTDDIAQSQYPYSESSFRADPRSSVKEQGATGSDWQLSGNHTVKNTYGVNSTSDSVWQWSITGKGSDYPAGRLMISKLTDENGNDVLTFSDKMGKTILKRVEVADTVEGTFMDYLETYYVYDKRGRMIYQVPPKAVEQLKDGGTWSSIKEQLVFQYEYDDKGRLVESKVPGAGVSSVAYDPLDRPVLTQDANMKANNQWIFTKWDKKGRKVITGIYTNTTHTSRPAIQQNVLDSLDYSSTYYEKKQSSTTHGYSNQTFPEVDTVLLSVVYYDDYDFNNDATDDFSYDDQDLASDSALTSRTRGLTTGSKTRILNSDQWLTSVVFYDNFGRAIQVRGNNHKRTTVDNSVTNVYDFRGNLIQTHTIHMVTSADTIAIDDYYKYDHAGRLLSTSRGINDDAPQQITAIEYNELGQPITKNLHKARSDGHYAQTIDYTYNIRGWLKSINDPDNITADKLFGMELFYNESETWLNQTSAYNGNISAMRWYNDSTNTIKGYAYSYDKVDRITKADYGEGSGFNTNPNRYGLSNLSYDANSNILALQRKGLDTNNALQTIDNLTYTYTGNQMEKVDDTGIDSLGFVESSAIATEYLYDANGNMVKDENKDIDTIFYNVLNKPDSIVFEDGRKVKYTYSANGSKLTQKLYQNTTLQQTLDYLGGMLYKDDTLEFIQIGEGRMVYKTNPVNEFAYQFDLTDHLGNVRTTVEAIEYIETVEYKATMETAEQALEEALFSNWDTRDNDGLYDHTDAGSIFNYSAGLVGENGPGIVLPVSKGDTIDIEVYAKYAADYSDEGVDELASAMLSSFATGFSGVGAGEVSFLEEIFGAGSAYNVVSAGDNSTSAPNAYLNYILFDNNMVYKRAGYTEVTTAAKGSFEYLTLLDNVIDEPGYIYIFVNNSSLGSGNTDDRVYFDDLKVTHTRVNYSVEKIQTDDYYPFGMQTGDSWVADNTDANNYLFNTGSEQNSTTGNYQTFFRDYDPALGRMTGIDIMASKYSSVSPYNYAFNDPIGLNDPSGADPYGGGANPGGWSFENGDWYDNRPPQYFESYVTNENLLNGEHGRSINWGNDGGQAAAIRRFMKGGANSFVSFLTDFANGINGDGVFTFSGSSIRTLHGVWGELESGDAIFWQMNDKGRAIEFLKEKAPQLLASLGGYLPAADDNYKAYARMTGVSRFFVFDAGETPFEILEWNWVGIGGQTYGKTTILATNEAPAGLRGQMIGSSGGSMGFPFPTLEFATAARGKLVLNKPVAGFNLEELFNTTKFTNSSSYTFLMIKVGNMKGYFKDHQTLAWHASLIGGGYGLGYSGSSTSVNFKNTNNKFFNYFD